MMPVDLNNHPIGAFQVSRRSPDGGGQENPAVGSDFGGLDDREIDFSEEAEADCLRNMGQVHVHVFHLLMVDHLPQLGAALVRSPPGNGSGLSQSFVDAFSA
jgi:hypothetical protein